MELCKSTVTFHPPEYAYEIQFRHMFKKKKKSAGTAVFKNSKEQIYLNYITFKTNENHYSHE